MHALDLPNRRLILPLLLNFAAENLGLFAIGMVEWANSAYCSFKLSPLFLEFLDTIFFKEYSYAKPPAAILLALKSR